MYEEKDSSNGISKHSRMTIKKHQGNRYQKIETEVEIHDNNNFMKRINHLNKKQMINSDTSSDEDEELKLNKTNKRMTRSNQNSSIETEQSIFEKMSTSTSTENNSKLNDKKLKKNSSISSNGKKLKDTLNNNLIDTQLKQGTVKNRKSSRNRKSRQFNTKNRTDLVIGMQFCKVTDLKFKRHIRAPKIQISCYDISSGNLFRKNSKIQKLTYGENSEYISPITTQDGNMILNSRLSFSWDELVVIEEDIKILDNEYFILFFELIDTFQEKPSSNVFYKKVISYQQTDEWYRICWGFLKPMSTITRFNEKFNIQLYKYKKSRKYATIFEQWKSKKYRKYRATLEMKLIPVKSKTIDAKKSLEMKTTDNENNLNENNTESFEDISILTQTSGWKKIRQRFLKEDIYEIQDKINFRQLLTKGSTCCSFSPDGMYLAFSETKSLKFSVIHILQANSKFNTVHILNGHTGIIHCLNWMRTSMLQLQKENSLSKYLLSASEDRSCIVWSIGKSSYRIQHVLPHPSFVYSACFIYDQNGIDFISIASGGRDSVLRLWRVNASLERPLETRTLRLFQEIQKHESYIVSVVYNWKTNILYSSEVDGIVWEWNQNQSSFEWEQVRKFDKFNSDINQIYFHPIRNLLYILTDTFLYSINTKSGFKRRLIIDSPIQSRKNCFRKMCFSPQGKYVFLSSELNSIYFWNLSSEKLVKSVKLPANQMICWMTINVDGNLMAISCYGEQSKMGAIYVYEFGNQKNDTTIVSKQIDQEETELNEHLNNNNSKGKTPKNIEFNLKSDNFRAILTKLDAFFKFGGGNNGAAAAATTTNAKYNVEEKFILGTDDEQRSSKDKNISIDDCDSTNKTFTVLKKTNEETYNNVEKDCCQIVELDNDTYSINSRILTDETDISQSLGEADSESH